MASHLARTPSRISSRHWWLSTRETLQRKSGRKRRRMRMGPGGSAPAGCATCAACCEGPAAAADQPSACNTACVPLLALCRQTCLLCAHTWPLGEGGQDYAPLLLLLAVVVGGLCPVLEPCEAKQRVPCSSVRHCNLWRPASKGPVSTVAVLLTLTGRRALQGSFLCWPSLRWCYWWHTTEGLHSCFKEGKSGSLIHQRQTKMLASFIALSHLCWRGKMCTLFIWAKMASDSFKVI